MFNRLLRLVLVTATCLWLAKGAPVRGAAAGDPSLRERAQAIRESLQAETVPDNTARVKLALRLGAFQETDSALPRLAAEDPLAALQVRACRALQTYRFAVAHGILDTLARLSDAPETRLLVYRWLFVTEDLRRADSLSRSQLARDSTDLPALLARGELALRLLRFDEAVALFRRAVPLTRDDEWRSHTILGLAKALGRQERFQAAFDTLLALFQPATLNDEVLSQAGLLLISLSRVTEAIDLLEEATVWNPWNEVAHYYLGNGYARLNYTQLAKHKAYAENFAGPSCSRLLSEAVRWMQEGIPDSARSWAQTAALLHPQAVEPLVLLGSLAWTEGDYETAEAHFRRALTLVPAHGRAHNGLAKALEGMRMRWSVHRAADSARFAALPEAVVPGIESFVVNWNSLSPRHKKQVALSIAPWKAYLPVLLECGSRFYIKPLHEKLSDCPGLATLRDQRVEYDARLWDDVRGCGGFMTVTGIEDVERSIFFGYNTVLHELTHQVHGLFPPADVQRIVDVFHAVKARPDSGRGVFLSRYQQASVWEYFAEGANALFSPRRDEYDAREIVRERLLERDSVLAALVESYLPAPNRDLCYPVGLVNAAEDAIEKQNLQAALAFARKAEARLPQSETVWHELSHIYSLLDQDSLAQAYADSLVRVYPQRANSHTQKTSARFFTDGDAAASIGILSRALSAVDSSERKEIRRALGRSLWYAGRYAEAAEQFRAVLQEVRDDPNALWGLGLALGDGGDMAGADSAFREALLRRSGIVEIRLDYARLLLANGRPEDAAIQLEEAQLLTPGDPTLITLKGWLAAEYGQWKEALRLLDRALDIAPDLRLAGVLRLHVRQHFQPPKRRDPRKREPLKHERQKLILQEQTDIPAWMFLERKAAYVPSRVWPQFQRDLLKKFLAAR